MDMHTVTLYPPVDVSTDGLHVPSHGRGGSNGSPTGQKGAGLGLGGGEIFDPFGIATKLVSHHTGLKEAAILSVFGK